MDNRNEAREFLTSRRAKINPQQAGLAPGSRRRVPGLRRSEVAMLADVSIEYYTRLERGNLAGASEQVLDAIARALQLDEAERSHLANLARAANGASPTPTRRRSSTHWTPRPSLQHALDAVTAGPAFVRNGRMDLLATNRLGYAFHAAVYEMPQRPANFARFTFLDLERSRRFYPDWDQAADIAVAILRTEAGRDPYDKGLQDLVGELSTRSPDFRTRWGAHNVRVHGSGSKTFYNAVVGEMTLAYEGMDLTDDPGLSLFIYTAEPGSASEERLRLLASWAASQSLPGYPALTPATAAGSA